MLSEIKLQYDNNDDGAVDESMRAYNGAQEIKREPIMMTNRLILILASLLGQFLQTEAFTAAPRVGVRKIRLPCNHDRPTPSALPVAKVATIGKRGSNVAVAGKLFPIIKTFFIGPIIKTFFIGPAKAKEIWSSVVGAVDVADLFLIAFFWLGASASVQVSL